MLLSRLIRFAAAGALITAVANASYASTSRMTGDVDSATVVALQGNVSPRAMLAKDLGAAPAGRRLDSMALRFTMSSAQQKALAQLLADQQNPASPRYRQWLTPEQFGAQFGLSVEDLGRISAWLSAQGFTVTEVARGRTFLRFSGTVAQAQQAFHTEIHSVSLNGERHISNLSAPLLPVAIASVTSAVTGLDDFRPRPHYRQSFEPGPASSTGPARPDYTAAATGNHYLAPGDFYTIYDEANLISSSITGSGVAIAVVGQTDITPGDIAAFRSASGLLTNPPTVLLYGADPGLSAADLTEAELDVEWAGAIAPAASIVFVNSTNALDGSLTEAVDNNIAPIISDSYGDCEADVGASSLAFFNGVLLMASAEGIAVTAAGGDSGATDCDVDVGSAVDGLAVDFPASSPQVTGVGGTQLNEGAGTYWSAANGANAGSALSYIPEIVWNDDNGAGLDAGGGGESFYFPKPAWQAGDGVPNDFSRDVPDVSLSASIVHDGYLICTSGDCSNGFLNAAGNLDVAGGTSFGPPEFAGLLALVEQKTGARLGNADPVIYALANSPYAANVFHDITSGSDASPCAAGSTNCPASGSIGFAATAGYDLASGWGSVDAYNMVNDWGLVTPVITTTGLTASMTTLVGSANSVVAGASTGFAVTVASGTSTSTATPTGTVQFTVDETRVGTAVALVAGTASYTLDTTGLSAGSHTVQATYSGDAAFAGSKAAFVVEIGAGVPDFSLSPSAATVSVASGGVAPGVVFTLNALNGFTGSVSFAASSTVASSSGSYTFSFSINPVVLTPTATSGATTLTLFAYTNSAQARAGLPRAGWYRAGSGAVLAGLLLFVLPRRRRISGMLVVVLSLGVVCLGAVGCATAKPAGSSGTAVSGTPPGTYTVDVTATATANGATSSHNSIVTFVVQ